MNDGNKEATKELLGTFRVIFTTSISIILLATNFQIRGQLVAKSVWMYWFSISSLTACCLSSLFLFFITISLLFNEEGSIPYQNLPIMFGMSALGFFLAGIVLLIFSQL